MDTRVCTWCKEEKPLYKFKVRKSSSRGRVWYCLKCEDDPERVSAYSKFGPKIDKMTLTLLEQGKKKCGKCKEILHVDEFYKDSRNKTTGLYSYCKRCHASEVRGKHVLHKGDICERCGFVAADPCQLDVDHINNDHDDNDEDNLQTLCANCHRLKSARPDLL